MTTVRSSTEWGAGSQSGDSGLGRWCGARTATDDRFDVDNCVGERGAVERLAGYFKRGEKEGSSHFSFLSGGRPK
jgi:hypothetical protein